LQASGRAVFRTVFFKILAKAFFVRLEKRQFHLFQISILNDFFRKSKAKISYHFFRNQIMQSLLHFFLGLKTKLPKGK